MPWGQRDEELATRLGMQLQETRLSEKLTVFETLRLFRSFYPESASVDEVLALVELESKRDARCGTLSGGQKQRLAVACALVGRPDVLFLDEPTTGLDPQSRRQLWSVLEAFRARGGTILLTTHYMEEAATLCDRVAIVDQGQGHRPGHPKKSRRLARCEPDRGVRARRGDDAAFDRRDLAGCPASRMSEARTAPASS